jgi:hypothetical protein
MAIWIIIRHTSAAKSVKILLVIIISRKHASSNYVICIIFYLEVDLHPILIRVVPQPFNDVFLLTLSCSPT